MFPFLAAVLGLFEGIFVLVSYVTNHSVFPTPLSPEQEAKLLEEMAKGSEEARNILIERNLRLVAHIVKKFDNTGEETDDLISIGTIGLIKAINTFDPEKKTRLATYAARCIENEILMHLRSTKKLRGEVMLHDPIGSDKEGNEITLMDILAADQDVEERVALNVEQQKMYEWIGGSAGGRKRYWSSATGFGAASGKPRGRFPRRLASPGATSPASKTVRCTSCSGKCRPRRASEPVWYNEGTREGREETRLIDLFCPDECVGSVLDIDLDDLWERGFRALIMDLDNTLLAWETDEIPAEAREWIERARAKGFKLCIASNGRSGRVMRIARTLGVPAIPKAIKPRKRPFRRALRSWGPLRRRPSSSATSFSPMSSAATGWTSTRF